MSVNSETSRAGHIIKIAICEILSHDILEIEDGAINIIGCDIICSEGVAKHEIENGVIQIDVPDWKIFGIDICVVDSIHVPEQSVGSGTVFYSDTIDTRPW